MAISQAVDTTLDLDLDREMTQGQLIWMRFRRHKLAIIGLVVLSILVLAAALAPVLSPYDPEYIDRTIEGPAAAMGYATPSFQHFFGTDDLNRDIFTRLLFASRISLFIGFAATLFSIAIGMLVGSLAGFYGGWVDSLLMRFVDLMLTLPYIPLLMILSAMLRQYKFEGLPPDETQIVTIITALVVLGWMGTARIVRGTILSVRQQEYVDAARALGARDARIIIRHLLPNALPPIIVSATLGIGQFIISESAISFLGVGINPPTASWGNMLTNFQTYMLVSPWMAIYPGAAIFLTVLSINFIGDGLQAAMDPRMPR
jgi:peptide/nickel transport system permease protein